MGYRFVACPLGRLLVARTEQGIAALYLGSEDGPLETALRTEYPTALLHREEGPLHPWIAALLDYLNGQTTQLDQPVDVPATAFQERVWEYLRTIPYGSTCSYSAIARALGQPTAARAVARACATNPVSLVIPCHRVVREDGHLSGYRWGLERKRALQALEQRLNFGV
ncbi:methylated-DNA--[protein]-cysteine S-methyltransferase [Anthocerotibacter panamensis]|uniref:methylated-DNA--[protein]-cysteine S-methyltransferase n=1 Tax=Anthocerotibacter panamensis TaxID=2857077 RepID=UPI001C403F6C|nr:methylated-DNA--[protein]-cysteine S-methyltransferase [Anthocerotibacter panamensis]